ncbi:PREDICTED: bifunctional purine biosynthesis protein PURH-like [Priapulus caudatus]|uniref:Bifunctional purine biosynthesis protein PURH-like n=1 Tax=Priapulus caudatus TaxID=37621 RepID=A0ABM1EPY4_PRICU|nr:PREDICTED: bifunctional purine biosynthesis protein PURH-like [Priapulus caudatus]
MVFKHGVKRAEMSNAIDVYVNCTVGQDMDRKVWEAQFENPPQLLSKDEREEWLATLSSVCLSSDAFFPFRDSIDRARQSGVEYVASPRGSAQDQVVIDACNDHKMALAHHSLRLFHH